MESSVDRFKDYSGSEAAAISAKNAASLKELESIPTLLMYESGAEGPKVVRYGALRDIALAGQSLTFRFDIARFFTKDVFDTFGKKLRIQEFEYNRTHWGSGQVLLAADITSTQQIISPEKQALRNSEFSN